MAHPLFFLKHFETERNKKEKDQNKSQNADGEAKTNNIHARLCSVTFFVFLWFHHHFAVLVLFWFCFGFLGSLTLKHAPCRNRFADPLHHFGRGADAETVCHGQQVCAVDSGELAVHFHEVLVRPLAVGVVGVGHVMRWSERPSCVSRVVLKSPFVVH